MKKKTQNVFEKFLNYPKCLCRYQCKLNVSVRLCNICTTKSAQNHGITLCIKMVYAVEPIELLRGLAIMRFTLHHTWSIFSKWRCTIVHYEALFCRMCYMEMLLGGGGSFARIIPDKERMEDKLCSCRRTEIRNQICLRFCLNASKILDFAMQTSTAKAMAQNKSGNMQDRKTWSLHLLVWLLEIIYMNLYFCHFQPNALSFHEALVLMYVCRFFGFHFDYLSLLMWICVCVCVVFSSCITYFSLQIAQFLAVSITFYRLSFVCTPSRW